MKKITVIFDNLDGIIRLHVDNRPAVLFNAVSSMMRYCDEMGLEPCVSDCHNIN